jgi:CHAT domain-containing protein
VPFAALYDARRRRYVIEDHTVIVSPAFTLFAQHAASAGDWRAARDLRAIVVTNPKTTGLISAQLPPLPGAEAEAEHLAGLFGDVRILRGAEATQARLRAALPGGQILHVASHARVNYRAPWRSYFVLAPDDGRPGEELLSMADLSSLPLRGLQLAVLAACGSADGPVALGGASLSLARPFLSAGVPNVVASLWPVSDRASRALFTDFYSHVVQGVAPAMALRDAQLAMLRNPDAGLQSPTFWAPFVAIGGTSGGRNGAAGSLSTRSTVRSNVERGAR